MEGTVLILKMIGALAIILGLLGVLAWVLKRFGRIGAYSSRGIVQVMETRGIAPRKFCSLIRCGNRYYLIAWTDNHISVVDRFEVKDLEGFKERLDTEVQRLDEQISED